VVRHGSLKVTARQDDGQSSDENRQFWTTTDLALKINREK